MVINKSMWDFHLSFFFFFFLAMCFFSGCIITQVLNFVALNHVYYIAIVNGPTGGQESYYSCKNIALWFEKYIQHLLTILNHLQNIWSHTAKSDFWLMHRKSGCSSDSNNKHILIKIKLTECLWSIRLSSVWFLLVYVHSSEERKTGMLSSDIYCLNIPQAEQGKVFSFAAPSTWNNLQAVLTISELVPLNEFRHFLENRQQESNASAFNYFC